MGPDDERAQVPAERTPPAKVSSGPSGDLEPGPVDRPSFLRSVVVRAVRPDREAGTDRAGTDGAGTDGAGADGTA